MSARGCVATPPTSLLLRDGESDFQPADPKTRGKWSDDDTGEGDSGYDVRNGERTAMAADDYREFLLD